MNKRKLILLLSILFFSCNSYSNFERGGMVSSANELATRVGIDIMKKGGNAVDAAVGVGFALAVVYPQAGNIGGGGFMIIHLNNPDLKLNTSIDYREKAPISSSKNMYLDDSGNVIDELSTTGSLAAGVPGSVAGMLYALEKYGTMNRKEILEYSINIADTGFFMEEGFAEALNSYQSEFTQFPGTMKTFGGNFKTGDRFVQKDLANTLRLISEKGRDGFYRGETAGKIVQLMKNTDGLISYEDLERYQPVERDVIRGTYRGYEIISMGPPSSGGISLIYLLNILENYDISKSGYGSTENIQIMTEAMRRVYADRSEFMGDADFVNVPIEKLTSKNYALSRMKDFKFDKAGISTEINPGDPFANESEETTHYSIADGKGNLVSVTTTINDVFGNKQVVDGAGFFLNNEMDDFVSKPGVPNIYGLVGNEANAIHPEKRMLSSMTPTLVFKTGKPFLVTGSPGGGRIITTVLQNILNLIDHKMTLKESIDAPRFHHQWLPDEIQIEKRLVSKEADEKLTVLGYYLKGISDFGRVNAILINDDGTMEGHSDRRGYGSAIGF
ncbi:MAG: gamma-glutamyltransferase [Ignavibacteria bacterium]|nr:gamma-glutamyltransferase [Ignavibacteria bacterium]